VKIARKLVGEDKGMIKEMHHFLWSQQNVFY